MQESDVIKTVRGDTIERRGIFLHPGLAIVFARWINPHLWQQNRNTKAF